MQNEEASDAQESTAVADIDSKQNFAAAALRLHSNGSGEKSYSSVKVKPFSRGSLNVAGAFGKLGVIRSVVSCDDLNRRETKEHVMERLVSFRLFFFIKRKSDIFVVNSED